MSDSGVARGTTLPGVTSVLDQIGNTPLLRLQRIGSEFPDVAILCKAEYCNPGGSVKDRPALNMILDGERTGRLKPGGMIVDSTSGNTGIAYAMVAAAKGYKVKLFLPANASPERKRILKAYGADVVLTDPATGSDGAILACREEYGTKLPVFVGYTSLHCPYPNQHRHYTVADVFADSASGRLSRVQRVKGIEPS
jgi:cysteine synthase B